MTRVTGNLSGLHACRRSEKVDWEDNVALARKYISFDEPTTHNTCLSCIDKQLK